MALGIVLLKKENVRWGKSGLRGDKTCLDQLLSYNYTRVSVILHLSPPPHRYTLLFLKFQNTWGGGNFYTGRLAQ